MEKLYFVMLESQTHEWVLPLLDEEGKDVALFSTREEARAAANDNRMGAHFGYEIFERGCGDQ